MTEETARREVAEYWMGRADSALASAASELAARRYDFAAEMKRLFAAGNQV